MWFSRLLAIGRTHSFELEYERLANPQGLLQNRLRPGAMAAGISPALPAAAQEPIKRIGGASLKISLNAYSFSKLLNDQIKHRGPGTSLFDLLDFCAKNDFEGIDPTGYFFPSYPEVPSDEIVNNFKRRAFELGIGISGTGVRNNFTTSDKTVRAAAVQHIKEWVEVASRLGAPVLRVFADTQMRAMTWHDVAKECTREQVQEWIVAALTECAEQGKKCGVIIGVQNHGDFLQTGEELLALINAVNSDWCGAIVDTGYFRSKDPYQDMAKVAPYAVNWQIKQKPVRRGPRDADGSGSTDEDRPHVRLSRLSADRNTVAQGPSLRSLHRRAGISETTSRGHCADGVSSMINSLTMRCTIALVLASVLARCSPKRQRRASISKPRCRPTRIIEDRRAAPDFSLKGVDGKTYTLADFKDSPMLMVVFLSNHCPYSHAAETRLLPLVEEMKWRRPGDGGDQSQQSRKQSD